MGLFREAERKMNLHLRSSRCTRTDREVGRPIRIKARNPLPGDRQTQTSRALRRPIRRQPYAIVADPDVHLVADALDAKRESATAGARRQPVTDGVFNQWLDEHTGHESPGHLRRDIDLDTQTVAEPDLLYGEVMIEEHQLFRQQEHGLSLRGQR